MTTESPRKFRVGISLSGGGAKGIAHLGVLQALEECGFKPQVIAGVSAGAIIGALYADGKSPKEICQFFLIHILLLHSRNYSESLKLNILMQN
jgi:NTE family protein